MSEIDTQKADHAHDPHHAIEIRVNKKKVTVYGHTQTGQGIKKAAGLPENFKLFDSHGHPVGDHEHVHVDADDRFTCISGQDVS